LEMWSSNKRNQIAFNHLSQQMMKFFDF